jgi:hypothetical protein
MSRELPPAKPDLEHLKRQAKDVLRNLREGDAATRPAPPCGSRASTR